jgi:ABC-type long-subunit fatty acid transport system fused permease/ATPase subunit
MVGTLIAFMVTLVVFLLCLWRERRPLEIGEVRMIPYVPIMLACLALLMAIAAHGIFLLTGFSIPGPNG